MKKILFVSIVLVASLFSLFSCATMPTAEEIASFDYGPRPSNPEETVKAYYSRVLFDPYSAVYTFDKVNTGWWKFFGQTKYGWVVCGTINAKNRMGGYVGATPFAVLIRYENVIDAVDKWMAAEWCAKL